MNYIVAVLFSCNILEMF